MDHFLLVVPLQPIEDLSITEKSLKVPLRGTFKLFSGFYVSAKRCDERIAHIKGIYSAMSWTSFVKKP